MDGFGDGVGNAMGRSGSGVRGIGGGNPAAADDHDRKPMSLSQAVDNAAITEDVGESFRYVIKTPVSLRRNEAAMLPIVNESIKGSKVFVFDPETHAKHHTIDEVEKTLPIDAMVAAAFAAAAVEHLSYPVIK